MKRLFISWLVAMIAMMSSSYVWHGVILNDLRSVTYPQWYFFLLLLLVYSGISLLITLIFHYAAPKRSLVLKGMAGGAAIGFFIYLIAFTLGISFKSGEMKHVTVDFIWQMIEQGIGGMMVAYVHVFAYRIEKAME